MNTYTAQIYFKLERVAFKYQQYLPRIAAALAVVCAVSAFLYGIFLLEAVAQAGSRTAAEHKIRAISSELSILEGQYLASTQALTPERAHALGFVMPQNVTTVVDTGVQTAFTFVPKK
jgi:hypothetical protein